MDTERLPMDFDGTATSSEADHLKVFLEQKNKPAVDTTSHVVESNSQDNIEDLLSHAKVTAAAENVIEIDDDVETDFARAEDDAVIAVLGVESPELSPRCSSAKTKNENHLSLLELDGTGPSQVQYFEAQAATKAEVAVVVRNSRLEPTYTEANKQIEVSEVDIEPSTIDSREDDAAIPEEARGSTIEQDTPAQQSSHALPRTSIEPPMSSRRRRSGVLLTLQMQKPRKQRLLLEKKTLSEEDEAGDSDQTTTSSDENRCNDSSDPRRVARAQRRRYELGSPISGWLREIGGSSGESNAYDLTEKQYLEGVNLDYTTDNQMNAQVPKPKSMSLAERATPSHSSSGHDGWTRAELLEHTNEVRLLLSERNISQKELAATSLILTKLLDDEKVSQRRIDLEAIAYSRLDRFLEAIFDEVKAAGFSLVSEKAFTNACVLQAKWKRRFEEAFEQIDNLRLEQMKKDGAFHDMILNHFDTCAQDMFIVQNYKPTTTHVEEDRIFNAGDWWLNLACAHRDGVTASPTKALNSCSHGVTTLALMNGSEERGENGRTTIYYGSGTNRDMPTLLIKCNMGRPLRLLRGSSLSSDFAPESGIRYDGFHKVKVFGHKFHGKGMWTWRIILEQLDDEPEMTSLLKIPTPSQMDDWNLYNLMIKTDRLARMEELECAEKVTSRRDGPEWDRELEKLRVSIAVAFSNRTERA